MVSDNVLRVYRPPLPGKIDAFARIASSVKIAFRRVLFWSGTAREQNQCQLPAWQLSLKTTNIHYSIIEGCRFLEHITSEKNVINLECKFAFINLMVAIHTTIKKINKHEKNRAEIRAADFSLEFRLKTSLQKMCLSAKLLASHEDVLRGSSRVLAPDVCGVGTRDEPLRTSPWEDTKLPNACLNICEVEFYGHEFASN